MVSLHSEGRYAFVELRTSEMATASLQLNGQVQLLGQVLSIGRPSGYVDPGKAAHAAHVAAEALAKFQVGGGGAGWGAGGGGARGASVRGHSVSAIQARAKSQVGGCCCGRRQEPGSIRLTEPCLLSAAAGRVASPADEAWPGPRDGG